MVPLKRDIIHDTDTSKTQRGDENTTETGQHSRHRHDTRKSKGDKEKITDTEAGTRDKNFETMILKL